MGGREKVVGVANPPPGSIPPMGFSGEAMLTLISIWHLWLALGGDPLPWVPPPAPPDFVPALARLTQAPG